MTRARQRGRASGPAAKLRKSSRPSAARNKASRTLTTRRKSVRGGAARNNPSRATATRVTPVPGRGGARPPAELAEELAEHTIQPTAAAIEAERTGVLPLQTGRSSRNRQIPGPEAETIRAGDEDVSPLANEYSGEEMPGGSMPTPDQNQVDDIGRAYGVEDEDTGSLRTSAELLGRRDRRRRE